MCSAQVRGEERWARKESPELVRDVIAPRRGMSEATKLAVGCLGVVDKTARAVAWVKAAEMARAEAEEAEAVAKLAVQ